jgi:hypothetical protein
MNFNLQFTFKTETCYKPRKTWGKIFDTVKFDEQELYVKTTTCALETFTGPCTGRVECSSRAV